MNTLRNTLLGAGALLAAALVSGQAAAQTSANTNVAINARVITPITITAGNSLDFGTFTSPAGGSATITIAPNDGSRTTGGTGTTALVTTGALNTNVGRGTFTIAGETGSAINISFTPAGVSAPFSIGSFTGNGCGYSAGTGTITGGSCVLGVGATLTVAQDAAAGTLSGATLTTTVSYQ